jgi:hypothetical protein
MATAINERWKVPVGYFLINGLNADERVNLVNKCLHLLNEVGVTCYSLVLFKKPKLVAIAAKQKKI